ncbi:MAG: guanylate kinase [Gemmataceae bacterium]|nr:guanylate kinase [Gemmataceae bacterium]
MTDVALAPLILVSGPSGSGKSTLIRRVLAEGGFPLRLAVSATTRPRREGERAGVDYHFWDRERFEAGLDADQFLEHAIVHGNLYGTPRSEVDGWREKGVGVLLDIDVQGADQVRPLYPDLATVFVRLSRWEMYEERLRLRGSETEASIARRLATARRELERVGDYQHVVVNDDLETALGQFRGLLARLFGSSTNEER